MAHIHEVLDSNLHFVIDPVTRVLRIDTEDPDKSGMTVIQYDHNSERVTFEIPRMVDGHDMTLCNVVEVHYLNVSTDGRTQASGAYVVDDIGVMADDENTVVGTWLISGNATQIAGTLNFLVRFVCITENTPDYVWNSAVYRSIVVSSGLNSGEAIVNEYPDVIAQWEARVSNLENHGGGHYPDWSRLKWYVMGDSLTAQNNNYTNKRYYDFVREKTGLQTIIDGIGGTGYGAGVSNGQHFVERVKNIPADVDVVTIFGSGNDIRYTDDGANREIYDALSWLCLNRPGLRVIVVPPAPWIGYNRREDPWKAYCDRLQVCALACNCRYVSDMYDCPPWGHFTEHQEMFFSTDLEGIHPNETGHKALAPYFYNALRQELALKE